MVPIEQKDGRPKKTLKTRSNHPLESTKRHFFVRYPDFFAVAKSESTQDTKDKDSVESAMVRHH